MLVTLSRPASMLLSEKQQKVARWVISVKGMVPHLHSLSQVSGLCKKAPWSSVYRVIENAFHSTAKGHGSWPRLTWQFLMFSASWESFSRSENNSQRLCLLATRSTHIQIVSTFYTLDCQFTRYSTHNLTLQPLYRHPSSLSASSHKKRQEL